MEKNTDSDCGRKKPGTALRMARAVLLSYAVTGLMLLFLAYLLFKCRLNEKTMAMSLAVVYVISAFAAGFFSGKCSEAHRALWGLVAGILYYVILAAASCLALRTPGSGAHGALPVFLMCSAGGAAGGIASAALRRNKQNSFKHTV